MILLVLKIVLVPALVAAVTLASRRWGPRIGGLLTSLPLVAGPILFFLAVEQGDVFAAGAAVSTLLALVGVAAFSLVYGWACRRAPWPASLALGWGAFAVAAALVHGAARWGPVLALGGALASFLVARRCLPPGRGAPSAGAPPAWDIPLRLGATAVVVVTVTTLAARLGPALTGVLTPFPVALGVLAGFAHSQRGSAEAIRLLQGCLSAMGGFALFCFVVAVALEPLGRVAAFGLALAVQVSVLALVAWRGGDLRARRRPVPPTPGTWDPGRRGASRPRG